MNRQRNQSTRLNGADTGEAPMTRDAGLAEIPAQLNELLERGEISPEAYAEYAATTDAARRIVSTRPTLAVRVSASQAAAPVPRAAAGPGRR